MSVLAVEGLRKSYGAIEALRGVDLEIAPGEIVGLLGPNGAGKSTLVSIVAGLIRADAGSVRILGRDVTRRRGDVNRLIGLAPQETGVHWVVTARENLLFAGQLYGLSGGDLRRRIEEVGEALDLTRLFPRQAQTLSTGERRRLHTAMAILHRPPLLLLDEPTVGADVQARGLLLRLVTALAAEGSAVCYSTHYMPEVEALGASVAIVDHGRIIARGPLAELVAAHRQAAVEITFDGPAPAVCLDARVQADGSVLRVASPSAPSVTLPAMLAALGAEVGRIRTIEVIEPGLEGVYLALTGRRYASDGEGP